MHASVCDLSGELDDDQEPHIYIQKCFPALIPLDFVCLDTSHIGFDALDGLDAILLAQEPGRFRLVRQEEEDAD